MSQHFAHIDPNTNLVTSVIVISEAVLDGRGGWYCAETSVFSPRNEWVECSPDKAFRKNFAGKGYEYDADHDAFYPPKPSNRPSFVKDITTGQWKPPKKKPPLPVRAAFEWTWSEADVDWVKTEIDTRDPKVRNQCLIDGNCVIDPITGKIVDK